MSGIKAGAWEEYLDKKVVLTTQREESSNQIEEREEREKKSSHSLFSRVLRYDAKI